MFEDEAILGERNLESAGGEPIFEVVAGDEDEEGILTISETFPADILA
ncbi:unnamed protein product, partial [marine sediment metagenome]